MPTKKPSLARAAAHQNPRKAKKTAPAVVAPPMEANALFPIVGVGASAGGLEAVKKFFMHVPADSGVAFVVAQHFDPAHKSILTDVLKKCTRMSVMQAADKTTVERNHVYVIPPNTNMELHRGILHLAERTMSRGQGLPINHFFRSLATDQRERAICILLSGTGTDGTLGIKAIQKEGGFAIVESSKSARNDGKPSNALKAGLVNRVIPPEKIAQQLMDYVQRSFESRTRQNGEFVSDITATNRVEETLRESEKRLSSIYETVADVIFHLQVEPEEQYRFASINQAFCDVTGLSREMVVGKKVNEIVPEPSLTMVLEKYRQAIEQNRVVRWEETSHYPTGELTGEISIAPVFAENGKCTHLVGSVHDMTERKRAEEELRFRAEILNAVGQSIIVTNVEGNVVYSNPAAEKLYGWPQAEALGKSIADIVVPQISQTAAIEIMTRLSEGTSWSGEFLVKRRDGTTFPVAVFDTPIFDQAGRFAGVIGISDDITERKQAEELLRQSETRTQNILDTISDGGQIIGHDWRFLYLNDAVVRQSGYAHREDLLGFTMMEKYPGIEKTALFANLRGCMEERTPHRMENRFNYLDGLDGWFDLYIHPVPEGLFILSHDITERKRAEAERQAHELQMVESQRLQSLGLLAGGVAHDINNLLTPIWTNVELLRLTSGNDSETNELFDAIVTATRRASDLVRQMLAFSGRHHLSLAQEDLNGLITENQTLLRASCPKNVVIKWDLTRDPLPFIADRTQIQQVVMNLLLNAIDAFAGRAGEILVTTHRQPSTSAASGADVVLVVRDTGSGIATENLPRIFEPFFTTKITGHGLGLSATQGIIRAHRGHLEVHSVVDEGTTFTIRLPMETTAITPTVITPTPPLPSTIPEAPPSQSLWLVIDDEPLVRRSTCRVLKLLKLRTLEAEDGASGLVLARQHSAELTGVVLDLTMPGMSGREVFQQLRAQYPTLPVMILSGYSEHAVEDLVLLPKVAFLAKPYIPQNLQQIILDLSQ